MTDPLDKWKSEFGNDYTKRNEITPDLIEARSNMWFNIFSNMPSPPGSILEIGAGNGQNMVAIGNALTFIAQNQNRPDLRCILHACEPNEQARINLQNNVPYVNAYPDSIYDINLEDGVVDFVFTSGVLIHIPPDQLDKAMAEMYRVSSKYIYIAEYFSPQCEEIKYRGNDGMLWRNDFGSLFLDKFKLRVVGYGFYWKRITKLDNLTWWLLEKVH